MKPLLKAAGLLFLLAIASPFAATPVARAEGIEVRSQQAQNQFPVGFRFTLSVASNVDVTSVKLKYRILPDGNIATTVAQCSTGLAVNCTANVGTSGSSSIVPKADVRYSWEVTDASGKTLNTDEASVTYEDTRFQWKSLSSGNITVYYYGGEEATFPAVLQAAREVIDRIGALEGTTVDFPVKILYYSSARDLQAALGPGRGNPGNSITLGEVATSDTALTSREGFSLDVVRHEVAHIVTRDAPGRIPIWLNEGISMYAQRTVEGEYKQGLELAIRRDKTYSIATLNSTAVRSNDPGLFYGQSESMVRFLITSEGEIKFRQFLAALNKEGPDDAMKQVYGYDTAGFENKWRASVGLPANAPSTTSSNERSLPTLVPFGSQGSGGSSTPAAGATTSPQAASDKDGGSALPIVLGAVAVVAVLGAGGGFYVMKRRRGPEAQPPA